MTDCTDLLEEPLTRAFSGGITIESINGNCRVVLPFVRSDGDRVSLYVRDEGGRYVITDHGETSGMLFTSGVNLDTPRRKNRVRAAEQRFDLDEGFDEIRLTASRDELGERVLEAYQAIQWIAFLEYTRKPQTMTNFRTKVAAYLDEEGWQFDTKHTVEAMSEPQTVDFAVQDTPSPTYMDSIHANSASDLESKCRDTAYKWLRIRPVQEDARLVSIVDDEEGEFVKERISPIVTDSDAVVQWSNRDSIPDVITA